MSTVMPRSALRHRPIQAEVQERVIAAPRTTQNQQLSLTKTTQAQTRQLHPLVIIGVSMLMSFLLLWVTQGLWLWGSTQLDTLRYGYPRTSKVERNVGHGRKSVFLATNQDCQIYVLEISAANPSASHLPIGPHLIGAGADLAPVQLVFVGNQVYPDLLVEVRSLAIRFSNKGGISVPASSESGTTHCALSCFDNGVHCVSPS